MSLSKGQTQGPNTQVKISQQTDTQWIATGCSGLHACFYLQDLLCYQLPEHANFYSELVGCMEEGAAEASNSGHATVTVLFNQFDRLQMQRTVGNQRCSKMFKSESATFLYC